MRRYGKLIQDHHSEYRDGGLSPGRLDKPIDRGTPVVMLRRDVCIYVCGECRREEKNSVE